jgi:hypothetical protein
MHLSREKVEGCTFNADRHQCSCCFTGWYPGFNQSVAGSQGKIYIFYSSYYNPTSFCSTFKENVFNIGLI